MQTFHTGKRKSVFRYLLFYNIIILLLPAVIGLTAYMRADGIVEDVLIAHANMTLKQSQSVVDERLKQVKEMAMKLSKDADILNFSSSVEKYEVDGIYGNYLIDKTLLEWITTNRFIERICIYFHKPAVVLSSGENAYDLERFLTSPDSFANAESAKWNQILTSNQSFSYVPVESGENADIAFSYLQNVPFGSHEAGGDKLIICMKRKTISDVFFSDTALGDGLSFILDNRNQIIYEDGNQAFSSFCAYDGENPSGNRVYASEQGEKYMISHVSSTETSWQYVSVIPLSLYMKTSRDLKFTTILLTAAGLCVGVFLCLAFARKSYQPVKKISKLVEGDSQRKNFEKNEWNTIENAIMEYKSSTLQYEKQLSIQQAALRENVLSRLLMNRPFDNMSKERMLEEAGLSFPYQRFVCGILDLTGVPEPFSDADKKSACAVIENIAGDIGQLTGTVRLVNYWDQSYMVIINLNDRVQDVLEELSGFFFFLLKLLKEHLSLDAVVSAGNPHEGLDGLAGSFSDAMKTKDYRRLESGSRVLFYQEVGGNGQKYYYPISMELSLIQHVKNGDTGKALEMIEFLVVKNFRELKLSSDMCKCLFMEMLSTAVKILDDADAELADLGNAGAKPFEELLLKETPGDMADALKDVYTRLCESMKAGQEENGNEKCRLVIAYIEENSCDPNLCLAMIADAFQMNQTYLSYFFRECTGETIGAFIRKLRINKVKELLEKTALPLSQIAERAGYSNSNVLIRNFRKEEGITPTQYRENCNHG